jgi:ankyrin repeat protein
MDKEFDQVHILIFFTNIFFQVEKAVDVGSIENIETLIQFKADVNVVDNKGNNLIHRAIKKTKILLIKPLCKLGNLILGNVYIYFFRCFCKSK